MSNFCIILYKFCVLLYLWHLHLTWFLCSIDCSWRLINTRSLPRLQKISTTGRESPSLFALLLQSWLRVSSNIIFNFIPSPYSHFIHIKCSITFAHIWTKFRLHCTLFWAYFPHLSFPYFIWYSWTWLLMIPLNSIIVYMFHILKTNFLLAAI